MVNATLTRGQESIDIPLQEEGGEILLSSTFGKPNTTIHESGGTIDPRVTDSWSGLQNLQLVGKLYDYPTAHDLADMVKGVSTSPLELSIPSESYPNTMRVAPSAGSDSALNVDFPAGRKDLVDVELTLTRIGQFNVENPQSAHTPRGTGNGPVQLQIGSRTVDLPTADLSLERAIGRPNDVIRRTRPNDPLYIGKAKVTSDVFTFSWETLEDIPETLNAITDNIFREQLGPHGVTVDFNGMLGLGAIEAVPVGSSPFRQVHQAGRGWVTVPVLEMRRIHEPQA